jgi:hypothetical protein
MRRIALAAVLTLVALAGCLPLSGHSWGGGSGGHDSVFRTDVTSDQWFRRSYTIEHLTCDDSVYLVLCSDCAGHGGQRNQLSTGLLSGRNGRPVPWTCFTRDGHGGRFTIDGVDYDLARGKVFLVTTRTDRPRVEQLDMSPGPLLGLGINGEPKKLAQADPRLAAFLDGCVDEEK